jgi:hypothetical protein
MLLYKPESMSLYFPALYTENLYKRPDIQLTMNRLADVAEIKNAKTEDS